MAIKNRNICAFYIFIQVSEIKISLSGDASLRRWSIQNAHPGFGMRVLMLGCLIGSAGLWLLFRQLIDDIGKIVHGRRVILDAADALFHRKIRGSRTDGQIGSGIEQDLLHPVVAGSALFFIEGAPGPYHQLMHSFIVIERLVDPRGAVDPTLHIAAEGIGAKAVQAGIVLSVGGDGGKTCAVIFAHRYGNSQLFQLCLNDLGKGLVDGRADCDIAGEGIFVAVANCRYFCASCGSQG